MQSVFVCTTSEHQENERNGTLQKPFWNLPRRMRQHYENTRRWYLHVSLKSLDVLLLLHHSLLLLLYLHLEEVVLLLQCSVLIVCQLEKSSKISLVLQTIQQKCNSSPHHLMAKCVPTRKEAPRLRAAYSFCLFFCAILSLRSQLSLNCPRDIASLLHFSM